MSYNHQYKPFFQLQLRDDDSGDAIPGVKLIPVLDCDTQISNHRLILRNSPFGAQLYYGEDSLLTPALLAPINQRTRFSFALSFINQEIRKKYFDNAITNTGNVALLHNLKADDSIDNQPVTRITRGGTVGSEDFGYLKPGRFQQTVNLSGSTTKLTVTGLNADSSSRDIALSSGSGETRVDVDISMLADGHYQLATDDQPLKATTIYKSESLLATPINLLIDIYIDQYQSTVPSSGLEFQARLSAS